MNEYKGSKWFSYPLSASVESAAVNSAFGLFGLFYEMNAYIVCMYAKSIYMRTDM